MIRLSNIFSDYMILQRETPQNLVWGYSDKSSVQIEIKDSKLAEVIFEAEVQSNEEGYFEAVLPAQTAGGDYILTITDSDETKTIEHLTFGDLFICGGQSNMELPLNRTLERYEDELSKAYDEDIRYFHVIEKFNFHHTEELITEGNWIFVKNPELLDMGAVPYFAAVELRKRKGVPIGLYNTAIGGTPVKSWCCEETMRRLGLHIEEFEQCQDDEYVISTQKKELAEDIRWREEADESFDHIPMDAQRGTVNMPQFFENIPELKDKIMAIYMHKEFEVPESFLNQKCKLYLGALIDADKTYLNGEFVGETGYLYPPRIYMIEPGILKKGTNRIDIKLLVFREQGGFMPGMHYALKAENGEEISLEGDWTYEISKEMPYLPNLTFFSYKATGVYNGMIYPLRKQKNKGIFFYQGESNILDYPHYQEEFEACIQDWRNLWNEPELPFIFVQLASWCEGRLDCGDWRACLADEQRKCTRLPKTAMAQAHDLGEYNELHPTNKKEVGRRIALAAEDLVYGTTKYVPGPQKTSVKWTKNGDMITAEITFDSDLILSHGYGVIVEEDRDEENVCGFYYVKDGKRYTAQAEFVSPSVIAVTVPSDCEAVSYAWADSALEANLYSEDRLPVVPFYEKR